MVRQAREWLSRLILYFRTFGAERKPYPKISTISPKLDKCLDTTKLGSAASKLEDMVFNKSRSMPVALTRAAVWSFLASMFK